MGGEGGGGRVGGGGGSESDNGGRHVGGWVGASKAKLLQKEKSEVRQSISQFSVHHLWGPHISS